MKSMKEKLANYKFNEECVELIKSAVINVRNELASKYDVENLGDHYKYTGLCDEACIMVKKEIQDAVDKQIIDHHSINLKDGDEELNVVIKLIHGEQKHLPRIQTKYWVLQHTWMEISFVKIVYNEFLLVSEFYVDPTSSQFYYLYDDIPEFYISHKAPKWFYPDEYNPAFYPSFTRALNENIMLPVKDDYGEIYKDGIIEIFQYKIWGRISQFIWETGL